MHIFKVRMLTFQKDSWRRLGLLVTFCPDQVRAICHRKTSVFLTQARNDHLTKRSDKLTAFFPLKVRCTINFSSASAGLVVVVE